MLLVERFPQIDEHWSSGLSTITIVISGEDCAIVNISSFAADRVFRKNWEACAKGALNTLTRSMALDLSDYGIRVNAVSPGIIWTEMVSSSGLGKLRLNR